ncbi:MAG: hypothetical protein K5894_08325 [Lachnospiraceae bacterium]|nr:hypothetical protein [Lachnospiraceae bacterium]
MTDLKYSKELYTDSGFFDGDMDCEYTDREEKLVKCRKSHKCTNCQKDIAKGDYAVCETALFPGKGWNNCYTCISCIEKWLEESGQVESEG